MKRPNPQDAVDKWNAKYPIGTRVTRYKLINPLREPSETKTRSEAWVMGGHSAMVMVEGVAGGVLVESVEASSVGRGNAEHAAHPVSQKDSSSTAVTQKEKGILEEADSGK